jgi:hypothetical protein
MPLGEASALETISEESWLTSEFGRVWLRVFASFYSYSVGWTWREGPY